MSILNSYKGGIFAGVLRDLSTPLKWNEIKPALDADELITKYKKSNLGPNRFLEKYPVPIKIARVASIFAGRASGTAHAGGTAPHVRTAHWGTALSSGDWSLSHDETAPTGELGQKLVVRNGRYLPSTIPAR